MEAWNYGSGWSKDVVKQCLEFENCSVCRWLDYKLHSYVQLQTRTVIERPHVLTGKTSFSRSQVRMTKVVVCSRQSH